VFVVVVAAVSVAGVVSETRSEFAIVADKYPQVAKMVLFCSMVCIRNRPPLNCGNSCLTVIEVLNASNRQAERGCQGSMRLVVAVTSLLSGTSRAERHPARFLPAGTKPRAPTDRRKKKEMKKKRKEKKEWPQRLQTNLLKPRQIPITSRVPEQNLNLLRQPRIERGAHRWQRWILPLNR